MENPPTNRDLVFSTMLAALDAIVQAKEAEEQYGYSDTQVAYMFKKAFNQVFDAVEMARGTHNAKA